MPEVDRVLGNEEKLDPDAYVAGTLGRKRHKARTRATPLPARRNPARGPL